MLEIHVGTRTADTGDSFCNRYMNVAENNKSFWKYLLEIHLENLSGNTCWKYILKIHVGNLFGNTC